MRQRIRLTEGDLHRIVRRCLNESLETNELYEKFEGQDQRYELWCLNMVDEILNLVDEFEKYRDMDFHLSFPLYNSSDSFQNSEVGVCLKNCAQRLAEINQDIDALKEYANRAKNTGYPDQAKRIGKVFI